MKKLKTMYMHDYGEATYLDGAMMRFSVWSERYPNGIPLAYFERRVHALAFASLIGEVVVQTTDKKRNPKKRRKS